MLLQDFYKIITSETPFGYWRHLLGITCLVVDWNKLYSFDWVATLHVWKQNRETEKKKTFMYFCCSVTQSCPTLCNPKHCSTPGFPVLHHLLEFAQTHVHSISDVIQPSHPLCPLLLLPSIFPIIRVFFPMNQLFPSGGQSIGASTAVSQWIFRVDFL